jgi:tetratricopeptide (TPR) repeat protein
MKIHYFFLATGLAAIGAPASAAVTVLGTSSARTCYLAAENRFAGSEAIADCNLAIGQHLADHDQVATHVNRGILKLRFADLPGAIADFDQAISLDPTEAEAYLNKGMALLRLPEGETAAIAQFDAALQKKTRHPAFAYYGRAIAHELNGRVKEAYHDYRRASDLEPGWSEPKKELARFTVRQQ